MKKLIALAMVLLLAACAQTWTPKCRHDAIYVMATVGEEYETRAVYGFMGEEYHVEVQAKIDNRWEYVTYEHGQMIKVDEIWAFMPVAYVGPEEYFDTTLRWMSEGRKGRQ